MRKLFLAAASAAFAVSALPAAATIVIYQTPGAVQPAENVLFQGAPPVGNVVLGYTNTTNTRVTFTGTEPLATPSAGQARITGVDGNISQLSFALDPGFGFKEVEFNIFGTGASATQALLSFTDQLGNVFSGTYAIASGQNFFSARAFDNQFITNVLFVLNGSVSDVRQIRIGGIADTGIGPGGDAVPEPASWAMMMAGMGLVGFGMRRRKTGIVVAS
ncbi:PEPxxWA-CTERM sorting domain-containing protein [Sandarakinorhabdus oryzae]|uniref:PEPxxWA-CTERM sorting domain-containing protein n=1 Tax=Sandarakinorhabdus oryzae TaxID=2675220 RepID=UPI0018CBF208|nr:PEPxxWA-CTERM sorting domain-containing protein [Sandarakinorhabdus oryzae]